VDGAWLPDLVVLDAELLGHMLGRDDG
jgi:hypothetical protein